MAKSSKKSKEAGAIDPAPNHQNGNGSATKPAAVKSAQSKATKTKAAPKSRATKPGKATAPGKSRTGAVRKADGRISDDEIRIRAYFISQHRMKEGRPGSSADDWLEARRQLEAEAKRRA